MGMIYVFNIYLRLDPTPAGADVTASSKPPVAFFFTLRCDTATALLPQTVFVVFLKTVVWHTHTSVCCTLFPFSCGGPIDQWWHRLFVTCLGIRISTKGFCAERLAGAAWFGQWCIVGFFSCVFLYCTSAPLIFSQTTMKSLCFLNNCFIQSPDFWLCRRTKQVTLFLRDGF